MIGALVAMELIWLAGLFGLGLLAVTVATAIADAAPGPIGLVLAAGAALVVWALAAALVAGLVPRPRPGRHGLVSAGSIAWGLGLVARRWLDIPIVGLLWRQSTLLRFLVLRLQGARVALSTQMSSDVHHLDPGFVTIGPRAMLGSAAVSSAHLFLGPSLVLAPITIGAEAQIGSEAKIGPGVVIGQRAVIQGAVILCPSVHVGDGAVVGLRATIGHDVRIGARAKVAACAWVPPRTVVPDDGEYPPPAADQPATEPRKD
ncbi:MAG: hypothetical protein IT385_21650 [Deltaproteobacteria bacterium]|nr:hypothetical protein [Deltaproteobacteria bacterium]